jgi:hypothetical protein
MRETEGDESDVLMRTVTTITCLMPCTADDGLSSSNVVDIFDATAGTWSTAALSVARGELAATSLPSAGLAFFAGGSGTCLLRLFKLLRDAFVCDGRCVRGMRALS